ncbi:citryl-CoA lyase [Sphingobium sp. 15-1]|uniref:citryl-CoA lyase n=1 Tax=Sphingobium sp. 15-1 TaxID=2729616 RepID=UPI00159C9F6B
MKTPRSQLSRYDSSSVHYRDHNLVEDLLGQASFIDVFAYQTLNRQIDAAERTVIEAVLICLMEHGLTPSAIAARMVYSSSPENIQAGVAAGLLAVGSRFVGTMEGCAALLENIVADPDPEGRAQAIAAGHRDRRSPVPGFGHHLHKPDDPRAAALLDLAERVGTAGPHADALRCLARQVDHVAGRHVTINATGAVAALLGDIGVPVRLMRGFAVLARAAGLIAHIAEEQLDPSDRFVWALVDGAMSSQDAD